MAAPDLRARRLHPGSADPVTPVSFPASSRLAKANGAIDDPLIREQLTSLGRIADHAVVRHGDDGRGATGMDNVSKLLWANWHRDLGELAMDIRARKGPADRRRRVRRVAAAVPVLPGRHHLRRVQRDSAQHHRRAVLGLREGEGLVASLADVRRRSPATAVDRQVVVVTARPAPASDRPPPAARWPRAPT